MAMPRVALAHDWLTGMRGGEKVLEVFGNLFPQAPLYTLLHKPGSVSATIENRRIVCSPLQRIPGISGRYRQFLPLMPWAMERLQIEPVDLVISTSSCVAKGVIPPLGAKHACYLFSPMRYLYDRFDDYFRVGRAHWTTRAAMRLVRPRLRRWDRQSCERIDRLATISKFVAERAERHYGLASDVIYPPVDIDRFADAARPSEGYYLMVTALVPYKNVDVALDAFRLLGRAGDRRLVVVGSGPLEARLRKAKPSHVEFTGWVDDDRLRELVGGCRAFLFPNVEDFGIAPIEAMAAGKPVIALGQGGALETIVDLDRFDRGHWPEVSGPTGLFMTGESPGDLAQAIERFEHSEQRFDADEIRVWARRFDRPQFARQILAWLDDVMKSESDLEFGDRTARRLAPASKADRVVSVVQ